MTRRFAAAACLAILVAGCQTDNQPRPPAPVDRVDHIDLFTSHTALNLDGAPGPDGTRAELFLYQRQKPQTQMIRGTVDFLLYEHEGQTDPDSLQRLLQRKPDYQWSFGEPQLARRRFMRMGLWGYWFVLDWGSNQPDTSRVVLLVRYTPAGADGRVLYSAPAIITVKAD
ncbi:MAG: hypothetical protein ACLFUJ_08065 [Phycisphaerae bacterium]